MIESITQVLSIAKFRKKYSLDIGSESEFMIYRALENNHYTVIYLQNMMYNNVLLYYIIRKLSCK